MRPIPKPLFQARTRALRKASDIRIKVESFADFACPFCGEFDLFVHPPGTQCWAGERTWWTIGCDSRACNSCWNMDVDTYEGAIRKLTHAQKP